MSQNSLNPSFSAQFLAGRDPTDISFLLWCSWQCCLHLLTLKVWRIMENTKSRFLREIIFRPDMRSSFNQLLAALASFDLLYLFTMLLEGVSWFECQFYVSNSSWVRYLTFTHSNFFQVLKYFLGPKFGLMCFFLPTNLFFPWRCHLFTCEPWNVANLSELSS